MQALCLGCLFLLAWSSRATELDQGFATPPNSARLRAYWWWLNGNVTKASITRDLEEMKARGFGGALICDAGGAEQDENDVVPHGPTFFTPEWRELYKHALREADRLGLEMSLNIQSGWNLGGPMVKAEDAPKKLVWSETLVSGPRQIEQQLPVPEFREDFYRDVFVVAYRLKSDKARAGIYAGLTASSQQPDHPASAAADNNPATFWASTNSLPGTGISSEKPEWIQFNFNQSVFADRLVIKGRPGYGPRQCELLASTDGKSFRSLKTFRVPGSQEAIITFPSTSATVFRLACMSAFDARSPRAPRNVQILEMELSGRDGAWSHKAGMRRPIENWSQKAMYSALHSSAPDTSPLFAEFPAEPGEEETVAAGVVDLTPQLGTDGVLRWNAPAGQWQVLRFGCTISDHNRVSTCSDGWQGYALDVLDAGAFQRYWAAVVEPLIADAGPLAGKTLKYLHTDSWEVEAINWTPSFREEFRARRGYDLLPYLPVMAGHIVESRPVSNRFLDDYRKTLGDLAVDHHFRLFRDLAHKHGMEIHPESGGPHAVPIDAQRCLGMDDAPMSEFWAWSPRHRVGDPNRFFVKQPASAAHTYGHPLVLAEGFTSVGPHWQETLCDNLKPAFDLAACEGLNRLVWHAFVCSPAEMGVPGQQYFAGTHFNPNTTWWSRSGAFLDYLNRCQFLLQQGRFFADVCYYYGDHVPNFSQLKRSDPAKILPGYDYDVATEEVFLNRLSVKAGQIVLPDGMSYRLLALPERRSISLPVLRKLRDFVNDGATVVGPKPVETRTLTGYPQADAEVARIAEELWGNCDGDKIQKKSFGKGRVICGMTSREVLLADGVKPDFEYRAGEISGPAGADSSAPEQPAGSLDYIHRQSGDTDIYFVANRSNVLVEADCTFRVAGKTPELWDPVTGKTCKAGTWSQSDGRTALPLQFVPFGSMFIVFREPIAKDAKSASAPNYPTFSPLKEISGPWTVKFDPKWGGPSSVSFDRLASWTTRPEEGIKHYSGTATYVTRFDLEKTPGTGGQRLALDLGEVKELAEVRLNGKSLGVLWAIPFRVDITDALKAGENQLEIDVVNFWPNRIIGDDLLPPDKRLTHTNIRRLTKDTPLMDSGLLGPVRILAEER